MHRNPRRLIPAAAVCLTLLSLFVLPAFASAPASPSNAEPTLTATVGGATITLKSEEPQYNVRSGPSTTAYPVIGVLLPGQSVIAKGRSPGGEWIEIVYPGAPTGVGWVATINLNIPPNLSIPVAEPPPTPVPAMTETLDPTLAAQFIVTPAPSRLPTYTPPPPLVIPTLPPAATTGGNGGIPMGMVIVILAGLGVFLGLVSLLRGR